MTLDLGEVDPPVWRVLINDTAYGPYTLGQMRSFISEGRIGLQTKVARGDGAPFITAETAIDLQEALREKILAQPKRRESDQDDSPNNYLIISRLSGMAQTGLMQLLNSFGNFGEALPGVYVLRSKTKLSSLQKALKQNTTERDKILIVNATTNRLGWFNLGPEADIHLRSVWDKDIS